METKTLLTKEVQENFFNEMRNEYQPWLDAIANNDFAKFEALLADEVEMYTSLTKLILRYGSPEFQRTFTNTYSLSEEAALCFLEYGDEKCVGKDVAGIAYHAKHVCRYIFQKKIADSFFHDIYSVR